MSTIGTDPTIAAAEQAATNAPEPPTVIAGRYEILGLLGTGGMGRVYRARDRELSEIVALKVLHRDYVQSAEMVERFRQEVRLARKVTHRNVARTFDIGEHGGEKFLTMELIAGEPLSAVMERGLLPLTEAIALGRAVLAGVGAAHAAGVVHRDLKPDNVLVENGGRVVVTDFGIARGEAQDETSRTGNRIVGTPAYMAPEQVSGTTPIDARADIYAFGAMFFELLTGRRAWPGTAAMAVAAARLVEPPPDPRAVRPSLAAPLAEIVLRCLARDREKRFASCADVDRALAAAEIVDESGATLAALTPPAQPPKPAPDDARERTVAVVPFRNFGPPEDAYFVEGLTEDLVDTLATVRGLRVRGRAYSEATDRDVVDTGRRIGVDVVVDGSVRRAGEMMRVNARLVGVADGFQLWSSRFDRRSGDAFALNDEVARAIADALSAKRAGLQRPQPTDPIAIDLYFKAKHAIGRFWASEEGVTDATTLLSQALARAPDDPTILAGYVQTIGRNLFAPIPTDEARALVRRALSAGAHLPEPWVALAAFRFNADQTPSALRAIRNAIEIAPSSADAHDLAGRMLLEVDLFDEALRHLDRTLWLDPNQRWARVDRMRAAALAGDWEKALELFEQGPGPEWIGHRAVHYSRLWSWPGAPELEERVMTVDIAPRFRTVIQQYMRARECGRGGPPFPIDELRRNMEVAMGEPGPKSRLRRFFNQMTAEQALLAGYPAAGLDLVEAAVDAGLVDLAWMNRLPLLDPVRSDPRFVALRRVVEDRAMRVRDAWTGPLESLDEALR